MTKSMIEYVLKDCICYYCSEPITSLARCACGKNGNRYKIIVKCLHVPPDDFLAEFEQQRYRAKVKRASINRQQRLNDAGSFTTEQIIELLKAQERSCYYCASDLFIDGKKKFHVDHYIALLNGGKNEIANIVLACPSCNIRKSFKEPIPFARQIEIELSDEKRIKVKLIKAKVKTFRRRKINQKPT
jgi:5-methylcytosine-specific restriction endonuclease McrA